MRCRPVVAYKHRLDSLFEQVKNIEAFADEPEVLAHWGKYLCILVSGFLEVAVREIYSDYADRKSTPHFACFVRQRLQKVTNLDMETIYWVVRGFSPQWEQELIDTADDACTSAVNSIIGQRNLIAHGKDGRSNVTFRQIRDWYERAIELVELMETQCGL